ncbi:MAG: DNA-binding response regulator [Bacteroidetes bacterium]|nr:MAG: DNA-binding response regulator [Bacteroidota bacterium]
MMKQLKVFIVEDELPAQKLLEKWIQSIPELILIGIYADGFSALKAIQAEKPDLVFLDIEMPKLNGLEILELLDDPPQIIFTTAYHEYAVKAFELAAIDYLLKPFSQERFERSVNKVLDTQKVLVPDLKKSLSKLKNAQQERQPLDRIVVKEGVNVHIIPVSEILFIEAQDDYVMIHTKEQKYLKLTSLRSLENSLPNGQFVRVHRSFIVNIDEISKIGNYSKDSHQIILSNGKNIKISRSGLVLLREILHL